MDQKSLTIFIQVAELGSFTRAGEALGYSQPTISFQIRQLENELGGSLIEGLAKCDRAGVAVKFIAHGADIPQSEAYDLFDEFIENGGSLNDLAEVIVTALENGGFIAKTALKAAKKIQNQLQNRAALRS